MTPRRRFIGAAAALCLAPRALYGAGDIRPKLGETIAVPPGATWTLDVAPAGGETLASTLDGIARWSIAPGALVVLRLTDGVHRQARTVRFSHPDGARIHIVGNVLAPNDCRLVWGEHTDGIHVGSGQTLGLLDGVTLFRDIPGGNDNGAQDNACGLVAENAGVLHAGPAVVVDGFYYGAQARFGGVIRARGVTVRGAGDAGFFAFNGGHIEARSARAASCRDAKLGLGSGFVAEYGGTIEATGARSTGNELAGFSSLSNGAIVASDAVATGNRHYGLYATTNGVIVAHRARLEDNGRKPIFMELGGRISGVGVA
jgi:hypothetical protein